MKDGDRNVAGIMQLLLGRGVDMDLVYEGGKIGMDIAASKGCDGIMTVSTNNHGLEAVCISTFGLRIFGADVATK